MIIKESGHTPAALTSPPLLVKSIRWLSMVGAISLYFTREIKVGYFAFFGLMFVLGLLFKNSERILKWASKAQTILALVSLVLAVYDFMSLSHSFLLAVAHFLLCIQALRLLSLQTTRENLGSLLLSSLMMISASTLSADWSFLLMLLIFVPSVIWSLMVYNLSSETEDMIANVRKENKAATFSLKRPAWINTVSSLRSAAVLAFVVTGLCCAFVFVLFPRFNFQGFKGQFLQPVAKSGIANQVSLSQQTNIFQDNSILMRIELDPNAAQHWPGYLRGQTLSEFDGTHWTRGSSNMDTAVYSLGGTFVFGVVSPSQRKSYHQKVYLESMDTGILFMAGQPLSLTLTRPVIYRSKDGSLRRVTNDTWRIYYEVLSDFGPATFPPLLTKQEEQLYLNLGDLQNNAELIALAKKMMGSETSVFKMAKKIETELQTHFHYSLQTTQSLNENPVMSFLFKTKTGHCEFFSSAMAVLLRAQGVPTRIVTGFLTHEWNKRGHYMVVRAKHSHAWVEVYIPQQGWIRFDPTPNDRELGLVSDERFSKWSELFDNLNLIWNRTIMSYDMDRQVSIFMSFNRRTQNLSLKFHWSWPHFQFHTASENPQAPAVPGAISMNGYLLVLGFVLVATLLLKRNRRKQGPYEWIYEDLMPLFRQLSASSLDKKTLGEGLLMTREKWGAHYQPVRYLVDEYYKLRFNPQYHLAASQEGILRQKLKEIKSAISH